MCASARVSTNASALGREIPTLPCISGSISAKRTHFAMQRMLAIRISFEFLLDFCKRRPQRLTVSHWVLTLSLTVDSHIGSDNGSSHRVLHLVLTLSLHIGSHTESSHWISHSSLTLGPYTRSHTEPYTRPHSLPYKQTQASVPSVRSEHCFDSSRFA